MQVLLNIKMLSDNIAYIEFIIKYYVGGHNVAASPFRIIPIPVVNYKDKRIIVNKLNKLIS